MTRVEIWNQIENSSNVTSDELLDLKKQLADEVVNKLIERDPDLLSIAKGSMTNYLVNDGSLKDLFRDEVIIWWLWSAFGVITPILKKYREMFSEVKTKSDLEKLKITIFNEMLWEGQTLATSSGANQASWTDKKDDFQESDGSSKTKDTSESGTVSDNNKQSDNGKKESSGGKDSKKSEKKDSIKSNKSSKESSAWSNERAKESSGEIHEIDKFNINVSADAKKLWDWLKWKEKPAVEPFACALKVYKTEKSKWRIKNPKYLTVVDFTKNQIKDNRLFVINMDTNTVEYAEKCGHGQGSGWKEWATSFWNTSWSNKSSLWALLTANHSRSNGKGTRQWNFWEWLEKSNSKSRGRWIAIHPVKSEVYASWKPTSQWCFTIQWSQKKVNEILDKIEWWSLLFSYAKSKDYFAQSDYFKQNSDGSVAA